MSRWSGHQPGPNVQGRCAKRREEETSAASQRRGFTTARSSASANRDQRASEASPHPFLADSQHGVRLRERPQSGRFASVNEVAQITATHNNALKPTRSSQTDWSPRGLVQCCAGTYGSESTVSQ